MVGVNLGDEMVESLLVKVWNRMVEWTLNYSSVPFICPHYDMYGHLMVDYKPQFQKKDWVFKYLEVGDPIGGVSWGKETKC